MFNLRKVYLILSICIAGHSATGQDANFAQLFSNKLYLNPAFVGNPEYHRAQLVYRNQWLSKHSPYQSYGVSYDRFFADHQSGLGLNIINDVQGEGVLNWLTLDLLYSYTFKISSNAQLKGGIQAGGILKSQNTKHLIFPDMIDPSGNIVESMGFSDQTRIMPDFAAGVLGEWDIFYGGIAVHHLFQPVEANNSNYEMTLPRKYTIHFGIERNIYRGSLLRKTLNFSPNIIYQNQFDNQQINFGLYLYNQQLVAGLWLRYNSGMVNNTIVFVTGYHSNDYSFAYSYDFSILQGGFRGANTSSHEVTFGLNFQYKNRSQNILHTIKSPIF